MYKKVLYNIKKIKKWVGGGGRAIFEPQTLSMYFFKKMTEPGLESMTAVWVRKTCSLIH